MDPGLTRAFQSYHAQQQEVQQQEKAQEQPAPADKQDQNIPQTHPSDQQQGVSTSGIGQEQPHFASISPGERSNNDSSAAWIPSVNRKRLGARKRSWVWNWFVQDNEDPDVAVCDQCGKIIHRLASDKGSPKKLAEHLRTHKITSQTESSVTRIDPSVLELHQQQTAELARRRRLASINDPLNGKESSPIGGDGLVVSGVNVDSVPGQQQQQHPPPAAVQPGGFSHVTRAELAGFDLAPYSQIKFHKDIMRFLTDNKLPISIVKSASFRQMVFTLRPESIADLNELNNIYASLMEVLRFNNDSGLNNSSSPVTATPSGPGAVDLAKASPSTISKAAVVNANNGADNTRTPVAPETNSNMF